MLPFSQKYLTLRASQSTTTDMIKMHLSLPFAAFGLAIAMQASAATEHAALMKAKKYSEAEKAAAAVLAREPANAEAMAARTEAILASGRVIRIEEAVTQAKQCVATQPTYARCHLVVGKALGMKAMQGGMMSAMGYAGDIRDAFKKAVELDPRDLDARFSLLQFYIMAPGIVGGGTGKGETLATQTSAINAEAGKLMLAKLDAAGDKLAKAEAAALAVRTGTDQELLDQQEELLVGIGFNHLGQKRYAEAERIFNDTLKRFPDSDNVVYGKARLNQEQGKHREAIAALELVLAKLDRPHIHYRIGKSLQALGDKPKAVAAYEKALASKADLSSKMRSDAEDQLKALKG
jgi:tetratricopeptide (TPR) repeat protein